MSNLAQVKATAAGLFTVAIAGVERWLDIANEWSIEYMPLLTTFGIITGTLLTGFWYGVAAWHKIQDINQRKRDRALWHKRMEHEERMAAQKREDDE